MEQKLLSIHVGAEVTRVCEITKKSATSITVTNASEVSTPAGAYDDGYITDVAALAEAIRGSVFGRGFATSKVIFTIGSKKIASKEIVIPFVKGGKKKIAQILEANSTEYFPMTAAGEFIFAHSIMENFQDEEGKKIRLTAVAAPRDLVDGYYELATELKLQVEDIDYLGNSVLQLLSLQMKDSSTILVLQIEKDLTYVNVMSGKDIILQRSVPYGKNAVINSMMEIKKLTEKEAKTLLSNRDMIDQQVTEEEYAEAVRYLVSSIGRIVEYHRSRNPERIIDGIKVFGEGSSIAGIDEVLRQELGAEVTRFSSLEGVKVSGKAYLSGDTALRYLANFGAVLQPIGLKIQVGSSKEQASKSANILLIILIVLAVLVMGTWSAIKAVSYFGLKSAKQLIEADIARMEDIEQIANNYENAANAYTIVKSFTDSTNSNNEILLDFINDLEKISPTGSQIKKFSAADGAISYSAIFYTDDKDVVADYIVELQKLDYVSGYSLPAIKVVQDEMSPEEAAARARAVAAGEEVTPAEHLEFDISVQIVNATASEISPEVEEALRMMNASGATTEENAEGGAQ